MFLFSLIPYAGSVFNLKSTGVKWFHGFLYSWIRDSAIKFSDVFCILPYTPMLGSSITGLDPWTNHDFTWQRSCFLMHLLKNYPAVWWLIQYTDIYSIPSGNLT